MALVREFSVTTRPGQHDVVSALQQRVAELSLRTAAADDKAVAASWLIHLVGDMHQPLHCADNQDRGGNSVRVILAGQTTNLHSAWDTVLLGRIGSEEQLFPVLLEESGKHAKKWRRGSVADWAEESHTAAQQKVYGKLPKAVPSTPVDLDEHYEGMAGPLIRTQLEKAGARLAHVLIEALQ